MFGDNKGETNFEEVIFRCLDELLLLLEMLFSTENFAIETSLQSGFEVIAKTTMLHRDVE